MRKVAVTPEVITIDGEPALIQAGSLHYFRLPHHDLWRPVLERMRMGGMNAALLPIPWAYHSPAAGFHDFTGPRDLPRLFDEVQRAGLWVIPHVGPWVGADLDAGGVPAWALRLQGTPPVWEGDASPERSSSFLRHVSIWWDELFPLFEERPNLVALAMDAGIRAGNREAPRVHELLLRLARQKGISVPVALPWPSDQMPPDGVLSLALFGDSRGTDSVPDQEARVFGLIELANLPPGPGRYGQSITRAFGGAHPQPLMVTPLSRGVVATALTPVHAGVNWGRWAAAGSATHAGIGAPLPEGGGLPDEYYRMRRMALTLETVGHVLADSGPAHDLDAAPPQRLAGARSGRDGTVAFLRGGSGREEFVALSLARNDGSLTVEDIPLAAGAAMVLPMDWQLAASRLRSTSIEPVLHTVVAGRELLILHNESGGEVLLPADFRVRHRRGPVYVERDPHGLLVHFDSTRLASIVLDGASGPVQLLALEPRLAARVWPLDDVWRKTPFHRAVWNPSLEDPVRGVVIGPDFVVPERDGGFRYQFGGKGFGYRWGPWRGSDPHTWLAPLAWTAPEHVTLPPLTWASRPGAPEVLPDYDDHDWRVILLQGDLPMEQQGIDYGFAWYRAVFSGAPLTVMLACRHACDLFLNGEHIASLNPSPDLGPVTPMTLPLPARHLRPENVLAVLVENQGREMPWELASLPHGLLSCVLEGGEISRWCVKAGLTGETRVQGFCGFADWDLVVEEGAPDITWHRSVFDLFLPEDVELPLFLALDQTPTICTIYLNGQMIGRARYPQDSQYRFWLPGGLLRRRGRNELLVAQWTRGADPGIGSAWLEAGAQLGWRSEGGN